MIDLKMAMLVTALSLAGCAMALTPEQKMVHELFVEAAHQCESRYHTIHVDQVELGGGVKIHAAADSQSEYRAFVNCYVEGLKARAEARRKAGLDVPEALTREPDVELD
jgi:hypothetical protein